MEKKKTIKISLTTAIMIIFIIALIVVGIVYYLYINNNASTNNTQNEIIVSEKSENATTTLESTEKLEMAKEEFPKEDGATAMRPMAVEIAKAVLGMTDEEAENFIVHNTTAKAYENLINKSADLIFVSEPSDDILNSANKSRR